MSKKICCKCEIEKDFFDFGKSSRSKDGLNYSCKECNNKRSKEYSKENYDKVLMAQRIWRQKHPDWVSDRNRKNYIKFGEKNKLRVKIWYKNNPEKKKEYRENYNPRKRERKKERQQYDPIYKITNNMRSSLHKYIKKLNITKRNKTFEIVGISPSELKEYLENQFIDGMNWENHGQFGWHIDHKIPLDSAKTENELYELCHYTNLQPLWWLDNIHKSSKIV
jgi:hypothetical protein